jgi:hypothetical protein
VYDLKCTLAAESGTAKTAWAAGRSTMRIIFVSVNQSFGSTMTMSQLARCAEKAWPVSLPQARDCDRLVAVKGGLPLASWEVHGAYPTEEIYETNGGPRARVGLVLGDPVPLLPEYYESPALRRGVAIVDM